MSIHWLHFILIFTVFVLGAGTAHATDDCNAKLVANRYYGAFVVSFASGKVTLADLQEALKRDEPYQPLNHSTPDPKLGAAKRYFAEIVRDPKVRAQWSETKTLLADFLQQQQENAKERQDAAHATDRLLAPKALHSFIWDEVPHLPFIELANGDVAIAKTERKDGEINAIVIISPEGDELHREKAPINSGSWLLEWHKDLNGEVWLYLVGKIVNTYEHRVYRMNWKTKVLVEVPAAPEAKAHLATAYNLQSVAGRFMLLTADRKAILDLAQDKVRFTNLYGVVGISQVAALDHNGSLALRDHALGYFYNNVIFKSADGHTYKINSPEQDLKITTTEDSHETTLTSDIRTEALLATDSLDGNLLIAKSGSKSTGMKIEIFEPRQANVPIFTVPISYQNPIMHWFHGPRGELLLGAASPDTLDIVDPKRKTHVSIPMAERIHGWFSTNKQTYFYTIESTRLQIYSLNQDAAK